MKFTIMQIKLEPMRVYGFMDYSYAINHGFKLDDYNEVYYGDMPLDEDEDIFHFLDNLFHIFNIQRPEDFEGHSMSTSDLVKLEDGRIFYCDFVGWRQLDNDLL